MHDAYEATPVIEKLPLSIESITTCDDNLLIGTKQGHLLMYSVSPARGEEKFEVHLVRSNKYFSKKPILQLVAVPELQILVCLSDGIVTVHDMAVFNFPLLFTINKSRGASLFALDNEKSTSTGEVVCNLRMCVVVKRRLQLFYWKTGDFHELAGDLCVPDVPKALAWCGDAVCVGFKQEYFHIKLSGKQTGLIQTNRTIEPIVIRLKDERLALCTERKSVFLNFEGKPTQKTSVEWSEPPVSMEHDPPYLLAVVSGQVEVRTIEPKLVIQDIKLTKPKLITTCNRSGRLFIASASNVWCLVSVATNLQIKQLLDQKQFELALQLVNLMTDTSGDREKQKKQIQNLYAFHLFCEFKFQDSMDIFFELGTDASHIIGLFPDLLPQDYRNQLEYPNPLPSLDGIKLENGLLALIEYLTQVRHTLMGDLNKNLPQAQAIVDGGTTIKSKRQLLQIIDTTLIKCYLRTNDALVASLLRLPDNYCHVEETERALKQYEKYGELIILYRCKGMHETALELLDRQAHKEDSPLKDHDRTIQYLQHLGKEHLSLIFRFSKWVLQEYPVDGIRIFTEDMSEIECLPREQVYNYLLEVAPKLVIPYLEHIIWQWDDHSPLFHNALVLQYQEQVLKKSKARDEDGEVNNEDANELTEMKSKLLSFLELSNHYIPEMLLVHFPYDSLFEERALLMGKLGKHEQALAIYTHILQDMIKAEEYCHKNYNKEDEGSKDVYLMLLKMYINPPDNVLADIMAPHMVKPEPNLIKALQLLKDHPCQIDPLKTLEILPNNIPLKELRTFLEHILQEKIGRKRSNQVLKGLLYAEQLQVHEQRINYQSQKIVITDLNNCVECNKRIGVSAFAQYPNGSIVHLYCHDKRQFAAGR